MGVPAVKERREGGEVQTGFTVVSFAICLKIFDKVWLRDLELKVECIDHL